VRTLVFVRDNGEEFVESMVNLRRPHELLLPYSRFMLASYLLQSGQQRVLIAGLGGGGMVHFYGITTRRSTCMPWRSIRP